MIKKLKKGFTLVELIVVIAIIAILSTVAVIGFTRTVDKANVSNDTQLVRNLNERMQLEEAATGYKKPETAHEAFVLTEDFGFIIEKLTPSSSGNDIVWDSTTNRFALISSEDQKVIYSDPTKDLSENPIDLWKVFKEVPSETPKYSIYLAGENFTSSITTSVDLDGVGLDVGKNLGITAINYTNTSVNPKNVVIRTNSASTNLSVNAPLDTVTHYGEVGNVKIIDVDPNHSYHEHGTVTGQLEIAKGHLVIESTASVPVVKVSATQSSDFSIKSSYSGTLGVIVAENPAVLVASGENQNITVTTATAVMNNDSQNAEAYSAEQGFLDDWQSIFGEGGEIILLKDVTLKTGRTLSNQINIKINLSKHTIAYTTGNQTSAFKVTDGAYLKLENGSLNFTLNSETGADSSITIEGAASVELVDIDYQTDGAALFVKGHAATVTVKNSTIEAPSSYAVGTNARTPGNYNVNINLINSTLKGKSPVLINVPGILNIDNSDIIGRMHGVIVRGGTATIKNSRITQDYTSNNSDNMYTYFDNNSWRDGNTLQLGGLIVGNKDETAYQYSSNVTVENTIITINTPTTSKGYFPAIFTYGNSGTSLGVSLTTSDVTLQGGKMVVGNEYVIINGTDYRNREGSFPVTIE